MQAIRDASPMPDSTIWFLAYKGMQTLDLTGPFEVLNGANQYMIRNGLDGIRYDLKIVGKSAMVQTESGLSLGASPLPDPIPGPHTLIIPGGRGVHAACQDPHLVEWVQEVAATGARLATVCTGTFLAGAAGLLDNQSVTTHWASTQRLQDTYPLCRVDADALYLQDSNLWSSAGVTAGIDLALALVEADHDPAVAQDIARWLVVFLRRPGGQSQFAPPIWNDQAVTSPVRMAQDLINSNPSADLSVESIALQVGFSPRHLSRLFSEEVGESPGRYIEAVRINAARHHLERSCDSLTLVASKCGFASAEVLRRAFQRQVGTSPDAYRKHHSVKPI